MFDRYLMRIVRADEAVLHIVRPSIWHYSMSLMRSGMVLLLGLFLVYPVLQFETVSVWAVGVLPILGLLGIVRVLFLRSHTALVITNKRLIDIDKPRLSERNVSECGLDEIRDVRYNRRGWVASLFGIGTVEVDGGSQRGYIACENVSRPEELQQRILRLRTALRSQRARSVAEENDEL